jgi:AraC-like DNA-binding protein
MRASKDNGSKRPPNLPGLVANLTDRDGACPEYLHTSGDYEDGNLLAVKLRMHGTHALSIHDPYRVNVIFSVSSAKLSFERPEYAATHADQEEYVSVVTPGQTARWSGQGDTDYLLLCMALPPAVIHSDGQPSGRCLSRDKVLLQIVRAISASMTAPNSLDSDESCAWSTIMSCHLLRCCSIERPHTRSLEQMSRSTARLTSVLDFIDENLHEPLTVDQLASLADMSKSVFSREFRGITGLPPHQYVLSQRVCRSQELLSASQRPLAAIATETGFSSQSHMTSAFHRFTGRTPSEYRIAMQQSRPWKAAHQPESIIENGPMRTVSTPPVPASRLPAALTDDRGRRS